MNLQCRGPRMTKRGRRFADDGAAEYGPRCLWRTGWIQTASIPAGAVTDQPRWESDVPNKEPGADAVGAGAALALDIAVLVIARGVAPSGSIITLLWLAALPGLVAAPVLGWRYGPAAAGRRSGWVRRATKEVLALTIVGWVLYIVFLTYGSPNLFGSAEEFLLYALFAGLAYAVGPIVVVTLLLGFLWQQLVRKFAHGREQGASDQTLLPR